MAIRNIVNIDESKCNGCGLCVNACAEGAIEIINGKARLVSEIYCDGLGACLGTCPQGAITVEQREAAVFDEQAVAAREKYKEMHKAQSQSHQSPTALPCGCPGSMARKLKNAESASTPQCEVEAGNRPQSQLSHWPVQLMLVSPQAEYFQGCDLLIAADCVPFAMADFHQRFLKGRSLVVGCPKLDDAAYYVDKLSEILKIGQLKSITVVHMEVPCCRRLTQIVEQAIAKSGVSLDYHDVTVSLRGEIQE
jgi:NAD-dependent dihydropyrimidine dehydrogenase PreA subunit